jgi:hypothetical protein
MSYRRSRYTTTVSVLLFIAFGYLSQGAQAALSASGAQLAPLSDQVVLAQPPNLKGGIILSSERTPDGSAADQYAWDAFKFAQNQTLTVITWTGAYDPERLGSGGGVVAFVVDIYASSAGGSQPDLGRGPIMHHEINGTAGEAKGSVIAGVQTYHYAFILPKPFEAAGQTKYWLQIEAQQPGSPDWGLAAGTGGDGVYFRRIPGQGENYQLVTGDVAFALIGPGSGKRFFLPLIVADNSFIRRTDL